jgi:tRNA-splicing ligase RtcB
VPPKQVRPGLLSWASDIEDATLEQAAKTARLPFVVGHVALMPDAHVGFGSTVGSVIPTAGAVIPSAIGVDIGCGMIAARTDLTASDLPDSLRALMPLVERRIPAGVGQAHSGADRAALSVLSELGRPRTELSAKQERTVATQFGSLGSGNHFVEVCLDDAGRGLAGAALGLAGIGNQLAQRAIEDAKGLMKRMFVTLEEPDLAYLVEGTPEFDTYIADMLWAQAYAFASRQKMMDAAQRSLFEVVGRGSVVKTVNCHHNFTQREHHLGRDVWLTRKGAIKAGVGDEGVIPGSMGTRSYIVRGRVRRRRSSPAPTAPDGGCRGRRARRELTVDSLTSAMEGRTWNADKAKALLDEHPSSYKSIDQVMADQEDLVEVTHVLRQVFNYKGT